MNTFRTFPSVNPLDRSWWMEEALRAEDDPQFCPALHGEHHYDVVVVGGGYTGLWTALLLRRRNPGLSIGLIEADVCGSGASGRNGGKVHGYWASVSAMARFLGDDGALEMAKAGTLAQDAIRAFATAPGRDVWWREGGNLRVTTSRAQIAKMATYLSEARRLGVEGTVRHLSQDAVRAYCNSPVFGEGLFFPEGANVHPARLVRAMRAEALAQGIAIFEHTPMLDLEQGAPSRIQTSNGQIIARDVVLATNVALATLPQVKPHVSVFSSYAAMSRPAPEALVKSNWRGEEGIADLRMFLHYFRKTPDGRVLMGSGSGPIAGNNRFDAARLTTDRPSAGRAEAGLRRLLPAFSDVPLEATWGGAIDVCSDRLPFVKTLPDARIHFGVGLSGHGVNPSYIVAQCLASKVLRENDWWANLPVCNRQIPTLPPEPFRLYGGRIVRRAILACEAADDRDLPQPRIARTVAKLPDLLGMRIGTR